MPVVNDFAMEIVSALSIQVPSIKVFRRGRLRDYMGPHLDSEEIAAYLLEDAKVMIPFARTLIVYIRHDFQYIIIIAISSTDQELRRYAQDSVV